MASERPSGPTAGGTVRRDGSDARGSKSPDERLVVPGLAATPSSSVPSSWSAAQRMPRANGSPRQRRSARRHRRTKPRLGQPGLHAVGVLPNPCGPLGRAVTPGGRAALRCKAALPQARALSRISLRSTTSAATPGARGSTIKRNQRDWPLPLADHIAPSEALPLAWALVTE